MSDVSYDGAGRDYPLGEYNGYEYEACAVMDSILQGKLECDVMPLEERAPI